MAVLMVGWLVGQRGNTMVWHWVEKTADNSAVLRVDDLADRSGEGLVARSVASLDIWMVAEKVVLLAGSKADLTVEC